MKVRHTLIFFFVLTLQDGNSGLLTAGHRILKGTEGGNITVTCTFTFSGDRKFFCKRECKEDVLIETTDDRRENGRYSIEYSKTSFLSYPVLYVSITQLTKSDSGRYRCGLGRRLFLDSHEEFEIIVTDAKSTTQSETTPPAHSGKLLYVGLILVVMIFLLSLAVLLFCRRRASKPKEPPVEREYASVSEANRVYEDIREDRLSRSPPVGISSVYTCTKYTKPNGVETNDDYSFADLNCASADSSQHKAADDLSKLTYSEVDFPSGTTASLSSAPGGNANDAVYSVPWLEESSDTSQAEDASPPLYSAITLPQQ